MYVSNTSNTLAVNFDNLAVRHYTGPLLEETHYYPFGLTMHGISSRASGRLENKYKFNAGTELNIDLGLSFYETQNRLYDPQLGRFWQVDELAEANWEWTTYNFALNNPISFNDPYGLFEENPLDKPDAGSKLAEVKDLKEVTVRSYNHKQLQSLYWVLRDKGIGFDRVGNDRLRERLERWDGIQRYMEVVHKGVKEDGLMLLEAASFFVPMSWLTKVKYLKNAITLFKAKRGAAVEKVATKLAEEGAEQVVKEGTTALVKTGLEVSVHAAQRMAERGITQKMVETALAKGTRYLDPKNGTFNYVIKNGFASGKDLLVGTNILTGKVTTVLRGSNLVKGRFIP